MNKLNELKNLRDSKSGTPVQDKSNLTRNKGDSKVNLTINTF